MKKLLFLGVFVLLISMGFIQGVNECREGYTRYTWTEKSESSPTGFSTMIECRKIESFQANIQPRNEVISGTISTLSGGDSVLLAKSSPKESQDEKDCYDKGCFEDDKCYPFGYRKDGNFCAVDYIVRDKNGRERYTANSNFVSQSEIGTECNNDFECLTNLCTGEICINKSEEISRQVDVKFEELKQEIIQKAEEELNKINESEGLPVETEYGEVAIQKNVFEKVLNWLKEILN